MDEGQNRVPVVSPLGPSNGLSSWENVLMERAWLGSADWLSDLARLLRICRTLTSYSRTLSPTSSFIQTTIVQMTTMVMMMETYRLHETTGLVGPYMGPLQDQSVSTVSFYALGLPLIEENASVLSPSSSNRGLLFKLCSCTDDLKL